MRRRVMTIAMATFFAGMMAFCDVDIIAAEENHYDIVKMTFIWTIIAFIIGKIW